MLGPGGYSMTFSQLAQKKKKKSMLLFFDLFLMMDKVMFLTGLKDPYWPVGEPDGPWADSVLPSSTQSFLGTI